MPPKPVENPRKSNKSIVFTAEEAAEVDQFLRELAAEKQQRVTFSDWARDLLLAAIRRRRR